MRQVREASPTLPETAALPCVGWIASVDENGQVFVDFSGNAQGQLAARTLVDIASHDIEADPCPAVLLNFDRGDAGKPIIVGLVREARVVPLAGEGPRSFDGVLDGKRLLFSASQEIVLRCGQGSITLTADGRVVVKGTRLVSRASETNKIKGASVDIN